MSFILHIETSTPLCSVAVSDDEKIHGELISGNTNDHAASLTLLISELLHKTAIDIKKIEAVSVSAGPGSYTGLRIGVSTAKGICHSLNIPLLGIDTLRSMTQAVQLKYKDEKMLYCPMVDARRMEVYCAIYRRELQTVLEPGARIIDKDIFSAYIESSPVIFFGSGAEKCRALLEHKNALVLTDFLQTAQNIVPLASDAYHKKTFADLAYFEPFYLKNFYSGKS